MTERPNRMVTRRAMVEGITGGFGLVLASFLPHIPDGSVAHASAETPLDFSTPQGYFFTQARGDFPVGYGYEITGRMYQKFQELGIDFLYRN